MPAIQVKDYITVTLQALLPSTPPEQFLNLTFDILAQMILKHLVSAALGVYNTPGLNLLDVCGLPPSLPAVTNKNVSRHCPPSSAW